MNYLYAFLIGYLIGSINPAYIISKFKGVDLRTIGSKNLGASNVKMAFGWKWFFVVMLFDTHKSYIAMRLVQLLFANNQFIVVAGAAAVLGHMFPFYLKFKGGKGFASLIGCTYGINQLWGIGITVLALAIAFLSNWIVAATITFCIASPLLAILIYRNDYIGFAILLLACSIILYLHKPNFIRLFKHEEFGINGCYVGTKIKYENKG